MADKKPLKDPKGGLTAAGRAKYKRETGSNLKAGVKGASDTPQKMRRKGSFLTRFFTNPSGPMVKPNGEPSRLALSANAWGEPVPKNRSDAARLAAKGRRLLDRYENIKKYNTNHDEIGRFSSGGTRRSAMPKKAVGGATKKEIDANTKRVVDLIAGDKGEETAKRLEPIVREAFKQFLNGDTSKPLVVNGKEIKNSGESISAQNFLDSIADQFGVEAVTGISEADFASGSAFKRINKYNQNHDELGRFSSGGSGSKVVPKKMNSRNAPTVLKALALKGGFTYNPKRNETRSSGVAVAISKNYEDKTSVEDFAKNGEKIIKDYMKKHSEVLAAPKTHVGAWVDKGKVYLDVSRVVSTVSEAADIGRANDQIGVFDLSTFTTWSRAKSHAGSGYKYFPQTKGVTPHTSGLGLVITGDGAIPHQLGKSDSPVIFVSVDDLLNDFSIKAFADKIRLMSPVSKEEPTSSDVHQDALMNNQKKKRKRTKKMMLSDVVEKHEELKKYNTNHDELGRFSSGGAKSRSAMPKGSFGRVRGLAGLARVAAAGGLKSSGGKVKSEVRSLKNGQSVRLAMPKVKTKRAALTPKQKKAREQDVKDSYERLTTKTEQFKTYIKPKNASESKKAKQVQDYMMPAVKKFKKPNTRAYATARVKQMTSGKSRPKGMSKSYKMTKSEVMAYESVLYRILRSGRLKYGI